VTVQDRADFSWSFDSLSAEFMRSVWCPTTLRRVVLDADDAAATKNHSVRSARCYDIGRDAPALGRMMELPSAMPEHIVGKPHTSFYAMVRPAAGRTCHWAGGGRLEVIT
jgi:hypothetical protein